MNNCECTHKHQPKKIVLTGGPGAGKTAVLEVARRFFCEHIEILPESASIIFGGGFLRHETLVAKKAAQRAIFHVQKELETLVEDEALAAMILCDRGTIDGLAYWPGDEASFWAELNTTKEIEFSRYQAVIHLRTPKHHQGYNHQNPMRTETVEEARVIDEKIFKAWDGHPRRFFIESTDHFFDKVNRTLEMLKNEIPECCRECILL